MHFSKTFKKFQCRQNMQMFGRKNLNNKLQFAISEEKVYAIIPILLQCIHKQDDIPNYMKKTSYFMYFFNDNLHEKTFFKKAETFKTSLETYF